MKSARRLWMQRKASPFVTIEALEISSSELRRRLAEGKSIRYLTPQVVVDHVMEHEFYREGVEHG